MYYILDAARSSQIILSMQNLERTYQESEAVLLSSYYKQRKGPQKVPKLRVSKMLKEISGQKIQF